MTRQGKKLLDSAGIKLTAVATDLLGVSCRQMVRAMIAGRRGPKQLAQLAKGRMRPKIALLEQALDGRFSDHHALLAGKMLDRIEDLDAHFLQLRRSIGSPWGKDHKVAMAAAIVAARAR